MTIALIQVNVIKLLHRKSTLNLSMLLFRLPQEREEAEALWAADGQSVVKKDKEEAEGGSTTTTTRNARSQVSKERSRGRGRVTGAKDELWEPQQTGKTKAGTSFCIYSSGKSLPHPTTWLKHQPWFYNMLFQFSPTHSLSSSCFICMYRKAGVYILYYIVYDEGKWG